MRILSMQLIRLQAVGYRVMKRMTLVAIRIIEREDAIKNQILITMVTAAVIGIIVAACQLIADSRVNWCQPTYGEIHICEGLSVEIKYLE